MEVNTTFILAGIGILSLLCQWLAWRVRVPAIVFLLATGIIMGPIAGMLVPAEIFGELLFPLVSLSVAIILFEGSLTLKFDEIKGHGSMVRNLIPAGTVVTCLIGTLAARWALDLTWPIAFLFGAIVVVTGPTVIVPMLRSVNPSPKLSSILRWEGIVIDPVGALLAVLVFEAIVSSGRGNVLQHSLYLFSLTLAIGTVLGCLGGYLMGLVLRKHLIPQYLHNAATLTFMLGLFALSNHFVHESGLLTVTVMGIWMANMKNVPIEDIIEFKESLSVLLISALFIILAARIEFGAIVALGSGLVWVLVAIMLIARPITVWLSAIGTGLSTQEKLFLSWISPRGIVAAAVSALFAFRLQELGYEDAGVLVPLVFMVIIATVTIQSLTARPIAKALGVAQPAAYGYLIMGANPVARQIAKVLHNREVPVMLTDTNYENIRQARMDNLSVYFGNPTSQHAKNHLDLTGIGNVLVISPYKQLNSLVSYHFLDWFGLGHVYTLYEGDQDQKARHQTADKIQQTRGLFGAGITYSKLASLVSKGYTVKSTQLTEEFAVEQYYKQYDGKALILFTLDPRGKIQPVTEQTLLKLEPGWELIGLVPPLEKERNKAKLKEQAQASASQAHSGPADAGNQPDPAS